MWKKHRIPSGIVATVAFAMTGGMTSSASAVTNQFRGVNWADSRDNFQPGVLYISGLSSSDTYDSAFAVGNAIVGQFVSKLGANAVRIPINEATVSQYWQTYTGAIDAALSKVMVVFCYWDSHKDNKPADMNAFWNMWKTVVDKYGSNDKAYFEIFNEPNMYTRTDLRDLYYSWLTRFSTIPKGRVILDGTGNAQNVPDVGGDSRLDGCLLAVHDYSFFGSESMTSESQWADHIKGSVGNYADRTICTEWGGPMSPGSKNGKSYDYLDYSKNPTNYFEAYIRGISSQLRSWKMGSFYWPGLRDGDWYSMTIKSGSGANINLTIPNQSGLERLQYAWTGPAPSEVDAGAGGTAGRDGGAQGGAGGSVTGAGGAAGGGGGTNVGSGGSGGSSAGSGGTVVAAGGSAGTIPGSTRTGGAMATGGVATGGAVVGGTTAAQGGQGGSASTATGGVASTGGTTSGRSGGSAAAGSSNAGASDDSGCSCTLGSASGASGRSHAALFALAALVTVLQIRRRRQR